MYLPTIYSTIDHFIHIVKDEQICVCTFPYHHFYSENQNNLRKIKFKHLQEITCPKCRSSINFTSQVKTYFIENNRMDEFDHEWLQIVKELMESNISKEEFKAFLELTKKEKKERKRGNKY
jgi:hypothetical protein